jgi:hypothetical protein
MKYFEYLPQKKFQSTIGEFSVCDFFTYADVSKSNIPTSPVTVDSKSNLLETSHLVYEDINSFWMFVLANQTINPFTLLTINSDIFTKENQPKTSIQITADTAGTTSYVFPIGSFILPYVSNTGGSYSYSSVGNFDLNGPISIIESAHYFNETMIIKDQRGATYSFILQDGNTGSQITIIIPNSDGTYSIQKPLLPYKTKSAIDEVAKIEVLEEGKIEEIAPPTKGKSSSTKTLPVVLASVEGTTSSVETTALKLVQFESKTIDSYLPQEIGILKTLFITAKYN